MALSGPSLLSAALAHIDVVPHAALGLDELHGSRHPARQEVDGGSCAGNAAFCAVTTSRYVDATLSDSGLRSVASAVCTAACCPLPLENTQADRFWAPEGGEDGLAIGRHRGIVDRSGLFSHRLAPTAIEDNFHD